MRHNYTKKLGENIDIFSYATNKNTYKMYQITDAGVTTDITPVNYIISSIGNGIYKVGVILPTINCIVCCVLNDTTVFLRVGNPIVRFCYRTGVINEVITYSRLDTLGAIIESGNLIEYGYGIYGFVPTDSVYSIIQLAGVNVTLSVPYGSHSGAILLNYNIGSSTWQQIAIPVAGVNVKEYFIDAIDAMIKTYDPTKSVTDVIERVSAYPGQINKFLTYIPGVTPVTAAGNFALMLSDNNNVEITAFWVKIKDYGVITNNTSLVFNWQTV